MSLIFTTITELIDDNVNTDDYSFSRAKKTRYINLSIDKLLLLAFGEGAGGTWELDDYNQTDYPIITTDLVQGRIDYPFVADETGNLVIDIYKVQVMNKEGRYVDLIPTDQQTQYYRGLNDNSGTTGIPTHYDKTANGIFLAPAPSEDKQNGLRVFINRESTYFTEEDTSKKWGYTGLWHEFLVLNASYLWARARGLENKNDLKRDTLEIEDRIRKHLGQRQRDVRKRFIPFREDNK